MTAFDNIKTNNWPATSNDFEDFLVLKLPLNDNASLTESLPVVAGSQELFPKRTLTNTGVSLLSTEGRVWSDTLDAANTNDLPFRGGGTIQDAFGSTSVQVETATNGEGRIIWLDFANNGGALTGSTLKVLSGGLTASLRDVYLNNASTASSNLGDLLNITGVTVNSIQITSNASNAGAGFAGIELDGVRLVDPAGGPKKHYDNNAVFDGSTTNSPQYFDLGDTGFKLNNNSWTLETWFYSTSYDGTIFWSGSGWNSNQGAMLQMRSADSGVAYYQGSGGSVATLTASNVSLNAWHHVALSANGSTVTMYVDGVSKGSATQNNSIGGFGDDFLIGAYRDTNYQPGPRNGLQGNLQDFRLYQGVAKYTSNFTPPGAILG